MPKHTDLYTFKTAFIQSRDAVWLVAQSDQLASLGSDASTLLRFERVTSSWGVAHVRWAALRCAAEPGPAARVFLLGTGGEILTYVRGTKPTEERIDEEGVRQRGPMRDLRWIGTHLYACGMSRQVYRREGPGQWSRADAGTVQALGDMQVAGFNAIDGLSEDDLWAVGFGGEIWRRKAGRWRPLASPTNVVLTRVRAIRPDLAYAVGQRGVLLQGKGDAWTTIDHGAMEEDLWAVEWFKDQLWVASAKGLYRLTDLGRLREVDLGLGEGRTHYDLHANDGLLWSVGPKHLAWTEDGVRWNDVA